MGTIIPWGFQQRQIDEILIVEGSLTDELPPISRGASIFMKLASSRLDGDCATIRSRSQISSEGGPAGGSFMAALREK